MHEISELFTAAMITLFVSWAGPLEKVSEVPYATMQECQTHKRQKEFTTTATEEGFFVFLCEYR